MFPSVFEQDLEQEDFDPEEYLERLAWRLTNSDSAQNTGEIPDPEDLRGQLEDEIQNLQLFSDRCQGKIGRLQNQCNEEGEDFYLTLDRLQNENDNACRQLKQIGTEVNTVSSRIIQLGEQLQSVDAPRMRAQDALTLMKHFDEFMSECPLKSDAFLLYDSDYDKLLEAADIIQKLHMIAQELPDNKFKTVRSRIQDMYIAIEHKLIETFRTFQKYNKKQQMIRIVKILSHFSGYTDCLNAFVEECQIAAIRGPKTADVFDEILTMVSSNKDLVMEIFINPEEVLAKMVLNSFEENLREYVRSRLENLDDDEAFLTLLFELYSKTQQLITALSQFKISKDDDFLPRLSKNLFDRYLDKYIRTELTFLSEHFNDLLGAYYLKHKHQKKIITGGGIRRSFQRSSFVPSCIGSTNVECDTSVAYGDSSLTNDKSISSKPKKTGFFKRHSSLRKVKNVFTRKNEPRIVEQAPS